jgi:hypothetical protein
MAQEIVRLYNCSNQLIQLQARPPKSDFYTNEMQVRLQPGQVATLDKAHLLKDQVENLCKRGLIRVVYDSQEQN